MTKEQIFDEVRRLPHEEQMDVLERLVEMVASPLNPEQEKGIVEAIDEADAGGLVDGPQAFEHLRGNIRRRQ